MYIRTYKRTYVYYIRLDSFGFGSASYQTKTKPKPYQNHTKTIPQTGTVLVRFWFGFWFGFEAEPASKTNQIWTKNEPKIDEIGFNILVQSVHHCTQILVWFLVQIWFVFDAGSASKPNQKPNQNRTGLWYGFGMVLVWFWFGFGLVWYEADPKPNEYT